MGCPARAIGVTIRVSLHRVTVTRLFSPRGLHLQPLRFLPARARLQLCPAASAPMQEPTGKGEPWETGAWATCAVLGHPARCTQLPSPPHPAGIKGPGNRARCHQ